MRQMAMGGRQDRLRTAMAQVRQRGLDCVVSKLSSIFIIVDRLCVCVCACVCVCVWLLAVLSAGQALRGGHPGGVHEDVLRQLRVRARREGPIGQGQGEGPLRQVHPQATRRKCVSLISRWPQHSKMCVGTFYAGCCCWHFDRLKLSRYKSNDERLCCRLL